MMRSNLGDTLDRVAARAASAIVAAGRIAAPALNATLLRRLAARPGHPDSLIADPIIELARVWQPGRATLAELSGNLLDGRLVDALDAAAEERMPRERTPYAHQVAAWEAARDGFSYLVTSGTGSGKTECFMMPMLDALLRDPARGRLDGVRAIVIYPLNALIESQRDRLAAWTERLADRISFALYNGLTPEKRDGNRILAKAELGDRQTIRARPPSILITNITMLEYLLLRAKDRPILDASQGLLRWIVLDEAHGYVGAQAAEMALLLRRVRSAFGVDASQVQLFATSATISEGDATAAKLRSFVGALGGVPDARVRVIEGVSISPTLPQRGSDTSLDPAMLEGLPPGELWSHLAHHPRIQDLRTAMTEAGIGLAEARRRLFDDMLDGRAADTEAVLDAAALAQDPKSGARLLHWRAHLFHRAQGGLWVCVDPACPVRDAELRAADADWKYGAVWLRQRERCGCDAQVFELLACVECGTPHLRAGMAMGAHAQLLACTGGEFDDFAVDVEPSPVGDEEEPPAMPPVRSEILLRPASGGALDRYLRLADGVVFDNLPTDQAGIVPITIFEEDTARGCCAQADLVDLRAQHYGPAFLMGNALPLMLEALAPSKGEAGLPMGGRLALTFSDSRQGTARLAAKLQQEAERTLTRAFLYHAVEEARGPEGAARAKLERRLATYRTDPVEFAEQIQEAEQELDGSATPIAWPDLVRRLAQQGELRDFASQVWRARGHGGQQMAETPELLARMFMLRELARRPRVQNNVETMGLLRLAWPAMERRALAQVPAVLQEAGVGAADWTGLALAAIDFSFRESLAVDITPEWMVRSVTPRGGWIQGMARPGLGAEDRPPQCRPWPSPNPINGRLSRLVRLIYAIINGDQNSRIDQDRARDVLGALWEVVAGTAAKDIGRGAWRLDFDKAAIVRPDRSWICPVTRRNFGYSPAGRSPYDPTRLLTPIVRPRLPFANAGGLDAVQRAEMTRWHGTDPAIKRLREVGQWSNLHDSAAVYPPFLRAQEHSAQIHRRILTLYEDQFKQGRINLLNCSTTMEMGVDIPHVSLVANSNVPPSASSYRQRVGRAGRRNEDWAFAITFCRNLPLDQMVFDSPARLLSAVISAPSVRLDSPLLVQRHVHAALLASFLRDQAGFSVRESTGSFFDAPDGADASRTPDGPADRFLAAMRGPWSQSQSLARDLAALVRGTALEGRETLNLAAAAAEAFASLLARWRLEHSELLSRGFAALDADMKKAFESRAKRMAGEFLLSELARRGFTPAYGFPVDVVSFDYLGGGDTTGEAGSGPAPVFGDRIGGASRTLDMAIREYAPGADVVIDGLVHLSEGVLPAWSAQVDDSGVEDLQSFWSCRHCSSFGLARSVPEACPACEVAGLSWIRTLRPAGFIGRKQPHTGYEQIGRVPYEMPRLRADGARWQALPDPSAGRLRADSGGEVITMSSGAHGLGYALCLQCGRAEAETAGDDGFVHPIPLRMRGHQALAAGNGTRLLDGRCPGGLTMRLQRNVRLVHAARGDVFELQLRRGADAAAGLALAAALRDALAERLGAEAREIGVAIGKSRGPAGELLVSAMLHDRAAGGAGLVSRLGEADWFRACVQVAAGRLDCSEGCEHGCPSCILRPDLSFAADQIDRKAGLDLARALRDRLDLPATLRVFGTQTTILDMRLADWLEGRRSAVSEVTLFLHGSPGQWDLAARPFSAFFDRLAQWGIPARVVLRLSSLTDREFDLPRKLDLHRLTAHATLAHVSELPFAGSAPIVAQVRFGDMCIGIAASAPAEALPGVDWASGATSPLLRGDMAVVTAKFLDSERLLTLSGGNGYLLRLNNQLDGPVNKFGSALWAEIRRAAPLTNAALLAHGVVDIEYTDQYLLTPLSLRLLYEAITAIPGNTGPRRITLRTARMDRPERPGNLAFHSFPDDFVRRKVMEALFPGAAVHVDANPNVAHARRLALRLGDGRLVTLLLDQGFGAWRVDGQSRHDFSADPGLQARALRTAAFRVAGDAASATPVVIEEQ